MEFLKDSLEKSQEWIPCQIPSGMMKSLKENRKNISEEAQMKFQNEAVVGILKKRFLKEF